MTLGNSSTSRIRDIIIGANEDARHKCNLINKSKELNKSEKAIKCFKIMKEANEKIKLRLRLK